MIAPSVKINKRHLPVAVAEAALDMMVAGFQLSGGQRHGAVSSHADARRPAPARRCHRSRTRWTSASKPSPLDQAQAALLVDVRAGIEQRSLVHACEGSQAALRLLGHQDVADGGEEAVHGAHVGGRDEGRFGAQPKMPVADAGTDAVVDALAGIAGFKVVGVEVGGLLRGDVEGRGAGTGRRRPRAWIVSATSSSRAVTRTNPCCVEWLAARISGTSNAVSATSGQHIESAVAANAWRQTRLMLAVASPMCMERSNDQTCLVSSPTEK